MLYATIWQVFVAVDTGLETLWYHSYQTADSDFDYNFGIFIAILDFTFGYVSRRVFLKTKISSQKFEKNGEFHKATIDQEITKTVAIGLYKFCALQCNQALSYIQILFRNW